VDCHTHEINEIKCQINEKWFHSIKRHFLLSVPRDIYRSRGHTEEWNIKLFSGLCFEETCAILLHTYTLCFNLFRSIYLYWVSHRYSNNDMFNFETSDFLLFFCKALPCDLNSYWRNSNPRFTWSSQHCIVTLIYNFTNHLKKKRNEMHIFFFLFFNASSIAKVRNIGRKSRLAFKIG